MDDILQKVILGWLLTWCNCPERGLSPLLKAEAAAAREAAAEGVSALREASKEDLDGALGRAMRAFPALCPDIPEERRQRMAARLARILEGAREATGAYEPLAGRRTDGADAGPDIG